MSLRRIIRDQRITDDDCQHLDDDAPLPDAGSCTVSLARWQSEHEALASTASGRIGVRIPNDIDVNEIIALLSNPACIALEFPKFSDGRAFSQARVLRDQLGYRGEIRAIGDVLRDQVSHMSRCGINAFELRADQSLEDALKAFQEMSVTYQPATDTAESIFQRRRKVS